ncbi:MAG: glycosyltransferase family 2 protein, partial [Planctomycetota bacterium]
VRTSTTSSSIPGSVSHPRSTELTAILPTYNEEGSVAVVVSGLLTRGVGEVLVADNGSTDRSADVAREAGARVVSAPVRGYGSACSGGLASLRENCRFVLFCDADGADDLARLRDVVTPVLDGEADLVIGSRVLGESEPGALSVQQRFGNWLAARLLRIFHRAEVTDLGPFRCVSREALDRIQMVDRGFGWTVEMQAKAYGLGLRTKEVPVDAKRRIAGKSKIGGNLRASVIAGKVILSTIWKHRKFGARSSGQ